MRSNLMRLYCVFDCVASEASAPFLQVNDGCARRAFEKLMRDTGVAGCEDFELYFIGVFDVDTMDIKQDAYNCIMTSKDVKKLDMISEVNEND